MLLLFSIYNTSINYSNHVHNCRLWFKVNKEEPLKYAQYVFAIVLKHVLFQKLKYATIASVGNSGYSR